MGMKGEYNPALKPKKRRKKEQQKRLFAWIPEKLKGQRSKHEKVVVLKNMFDPEEIANKPERLLEISEELREECGKCGSVKKVVVHDRHPDGAVQIYFSSPEEADYAVQFMNRRYFGSRRVIAETWDGTTRYAVEESKEQE